MGISSIVSGGASIVGGLIGKSSSDKAADAAADAASAASEVEREIFYQNREDLAPYRQAGGNALAALQYELGLGGLPYFAPGQGVDADGNILGVKYSENGQIPLFDPSASSEDDQGSSNAFAGGQLPRYDPLDFPDEGGGANAGFANFFNNVYLPAFEEQQEAAASQGADPTGSPGLRYSGFKETPSYQFRVDQGQRGIDNNAAARGMALSGDTIRDSIAFRDGLAASEYDTYLNRLSGLAGTGQTATNTTASLGANYASSVGANNLFAGQARSSAYQQGGNALAGAVGGLANSLGNAFAAPSAYNPRIPYIPTGVF